MPSDGSTVKTTPSHTCSTAAMEPVRRTAGAGLYRRNYRRAPVNFSSCCSLWPAIIFGGEIGAGQSVVRSAHPCLPFRKNSGIRFARPSHRCRNPHSFCNRLRTLLSDRYPYTYTYVPAFAGIAALFGFLTYYFLVLSSSLGKRSRKNLSLCQ
jgi:hypothetical protein